MEKPIYSPTLEDFKKSARAYNVVPVSRDILADTLTPVAAFMKIDAGGDAFLLESVEGGEKWGRYSFLGSSARAVVRGKKDGVEIIEDGKTTVKKGDPFELLSSYISSFSVPPVLSGSRFSGGAIGYMGYDMVRYIERLPDTAAKDLDLYEFYFVVTDTFLIFDNMEHKIKVVANAVVKDGVAPEAAYAAAIAKIDALVLKLKQGAVKPDSPAVGARPVEANFTKPAFMDAVKKVKEYINAGDIIQAVISQRFSTELNCRPFDIYRALRVVNPSPYMFFLRLGGITLAGSSPEILVRVEGREINLRPIAGTRPRGANLIEDVRLEEELLRDPKERAEHIMLVDLGRNDLGRVSKAGTVLVDEFMVVERYSHVMHIVSNVRGLAKEGCTCFDVLKAAFPAGTLTGAPKVRAMEIIEEVEPQKRGIYGGSVGYFDFSGNMDMCITIRTVLVKDDKIYVQAGAGIVADSDPEKEYEETVNKAKGVLKAVDMARGGFN